MFMFLIILKYLQLLCRDDTKRAHKFDINTPGDLLRDAECNTAKRL